MKFHTYKWHSINIIPSFSIITICDDNNFDRVVANLIQITLFGFVLNCEIKTTKQRTYFGKTYGPLWSRRRRVWYMPEKLDDEPTFSLKQ